VYISCYFVPAQEVIFGVPRAYTKIQCQKQSVFFLQQSRSTYLRSVVQLDLSDKSLSLGSRTT